MKTPREILLRQHEPMQARLDEACRTVQAETLRNVTAAPSKRRSADGPSFFGLLWQELFWTVRWTWAGFAVVWTLVVSVNLAISDKPRVLPAEAFADFSTLLGALETSERPRSLQQPASPSQTLRPSSMATNV